MDSKRQKTLDSIVNEILLESQIDKSQYYRVLSFAIKAIRDINLFSYGTTMKCAKLITDNNHMVDLPGDYLDFVSIGIPHNGELITFTKDKKLIRTTTLVNGVNSLSVDNGEGVVKKDGRLWGYGSTGGHNDYVYCIDLNLGKIIINSHKLISYPDKTPVNKEIQLWYTTSGVSLDGETLVSSIISDAVNAYVTYYMALRSPIKTRADAMKINLYKQDYEKEIHKLTMIRGGFSYDDLSDFFLSMYHQSPGR